MIKKAVGEKEKKQQNKLASPDWEIAFDAAEDIISIISTDFEILKVNKSGCEKIGKKRESLIGQKCYEVIHGASAPPENCACKLAIEKKGYSSRELSEHGRRYITTAAPIFDKKNNITSFTHIVKDITEKHHLKNKLIKNNDLMKNKIKLGNDELAKAKNKLLKEKQKRKKAENQFKKSRSELDKKNIVLSGIVDQINVGNSNYGNEIRANLEQLIIPTLQKISSDKESEKFKEIIKHQIKDLNSSYGIKISSPKFNLSPREIEICSYVKSGLSSKEIAILIHLSVKTVDKHRRNIRKKLNIAKSEINLASYLMHEL